MTSPILFIHWSAKTFAGAYGCYFFVCLGVLLVVRELQRKKWSHGIETSTPPSSHDLAMLAGGPVRAAQLTMLQLLGRGVIEGKKNSFGSTRAHLLSRDYKAQNHIEKELITLLTKKKSSKKGVSFSKLTSLILPLFSHTEEQLAVRGLYATRDDLKALKHKLRFFVLLFLVPGVVRVVSALQKDEPVLGALVITCLGSLILSAFSHTHPLTSQGKKVLKETRQSLLETQTHQSNRDVLAFAVLGWIGIVNTPLAAQIGPGSCSYLKAHANPKNDPPSGGCGGDSGCGGGCGGCGD